MNDILQNPAWIGVIGTLLGGLVVGAFTVLSKRSERNSESRKITREKLETLHLGLIKYYRSLEFAREKTLVAAETKTGAKTLVDIIGEDLDLPLIEMYSTQRIYARELNGHFRDLTATVGEL